jgi:GNAT superfamily N-acetyltransferase
MKIIDINESNVVEKGFFCNMSKKKSAGYQRKLKWLKRRFAEGLKIKMLDLSEGGRGFIEYIPGEYAWRPVRAKEYMFIHCIWVVGKSKGKGYGKFLLNECVEDAKKLGMKGVAVISSERSWLVRKAFLEKQGFEFVDQAPPSFGLLVKKFGKAHPPAFTGNWEAKLKRCGTGLTVFRSDQCPYIDNAVNILVDAAEQLEIKTKVIELKECRSVRASSPSAYGTFNVVYNGSLLSYHYLTRKESLKRLAQSRK